MSNNRPSTMRRLLAQTRRRWPLRKPYLRPVFALFFAVQFLEIVPWLPEMCKQNTETPPAL
jgi:hypothetical protein